MAGPIMKERRSRRRGRRPPRRGRPPHVGEKSRRQREAVHMAQGGHGRSLMERRRAGGRGRQSSWRRQAMGVPSWGKIRALEAPAELLRGRWLANNCFLLQNLLHRKAGGEGKWQTSFLLVSQPFVLQTNHCDPLVLSSWQEKEQRGKGGLCLGVWTKMVSLFTVWAKHQHDEPTT